MVVRIGTLAQQKLIIGATLTTQARLADTQVQIATGKKSQSYSGLARDTSRLLNLKNELAKAEQFVANIGTAEKRLGLMNFSLDKIDEIARDARSIFRNSLNGETASINNISEIARQFLLEVKDLLNQRDDSRYLFAGGRTDQPPIDFANGVYTPPVPPPFDPTADTGYYEGDTVIQEVRADDSLVVPYGVLANESAFEKIIRALDHVAQTTFANPITPAQTQMLNDAITALTEATENNGAQKTVGEIAANVALDLRLLDSQRQNHEEFMNFSIDSIADIENVNTAEAIATLNFQQVQLEASFEVIARLGRLTLTSFLR
jgi:flagellar hook-associated protein 3 FlgL